jgi:hypothetical protein
VLLEPCNDRPLLFNPKAWWSARAVDININNTHIDLSDSHPTPTQSYELRESVYERMGLG